MSDANPYESPATTSRAETQENPRETARPVRGDDGTVIRYAQLGLRLLGVMFCFEAAFGIVGSLVYGVMYAFALQQAGYAPMPDSYAFGWFATSVACLIGGLYLVISGRWVLENVFLPSSRTSITEEDDDATGAQA